MLFRSKTIEGLAEGSITPIPQDEAQATHVGMIKKSMGNLDFSRSAVELERLVRGLNPWPSAYTHLGNKTLKVWKARVDTDTKTEAQPGEVVSSDAFGIAVATGEGLLVMEEIQLEGKKRMCVADFLRGREIPVGTMLCG